MAETEFHYPSLFDQVPIGLIRSAYDGQLQDVNRALVEMLGYPDKPSLLATPVVELYDDLHDRDEISAWLEQETELRNYEMRIRRHDGGTIWVRLNARAVRNARGEINYFEGTLEDISNEQAASSALQESLHFSRTIIASVGEGVVVYDADLRYVVWNNFMESLTGILQDELLGKPAAEAFPRLKEQGIEAMLLRALAGETVYAEGLPYNFPRSKNQGWYSAVYSPHISSTGEIIGVVATIHDITERKHFEAEQERLLLSEYNLRLQAETLGRVSQAMNAVLEMPALLDSICKESARLFNVESAHIWLVKKNAEDGSEYLQGIAGFGRGRDQVVGMRVPLGDPINLGARVIRARQPVCINEVKDELHTGLSSIFKVASILGVPLFKGETAIGALLIVNNRKMNAFTNEDLEIAMQLGNHAAIAVNNARLFDDAQSARENLERSYVNTLEGWAKALELRDAETEGHSQRVTEMAVRLARAMGIRDEMLEHLRRGALLHDIGKMGIPDRILGKSDELSGEEWRIMRQHPVYAYELLSSIEYLRPALVIPFLHHEKWDGTGYPLGLDGEKIPLPARIFAVVDVFDALTSDRPYRHAWPRERAIQYITSNAGKHFDPAVVDVFLKIMGGA
jgi:PAS domain S-box-containing protein/putative nucleotidyltransferase with HDIG domain